MTVTSSPNDLPAESVRKSLALANAHGLGPFKRRVSIAVEPYEPEEVYTEFTLDVRLPKPMWNYEGNLPDTPVTQVLTTRPLLKISDLGYFRDVAAAPSIQSQFSKSARDFRTPGLLADEFHILSQDTYTAGFEFNRNGMHYTLMFYVPYSNYDPQAHFTISPQHGLSFLSEREMTKAEAEYALDILEAELSGEEKTFFQHGLSRLKGNLPSRNQPEDTLLIEQLRNWKKFNSENYGLSAQHTDSGCYFQKTYAVVP